MEFPKFKAAAVQSSPVFLNPSKTADKIVSLCKEAAGNGAQLVAFPEVFLAGYPYWNWVLNPIDASPWFEKLYRSSVSTDGPEVEQVKKVAKKLGIYVVLGLNERGESYGEIYNTNIIINDQGELIGKHRKLVPTWAEKLSWTSGDGSSLKVYPSPYGAIGTLACGENTNPLARYSLLAQGEKIHIANYISLPVAPPDYNMAKAIEIRAAAHSFEGKIFTIVSCSTLSKEIIKALEPEVPDIAERFERKNSAFSGIVGPNGVTVGDPLIDDEGIVYADIDLAKGIQPKQMHDILGHYNRFDIFDLRVNTQATKRITLIDNEKDWKNER